MAKGDDKRRKNEAYDVASRYPTALLDDVISPQMHTFWNNYKSNLPQAQADQRNIMGRYQNFADTGGFSNADLANIRARSISPIRSVYSRSLAELDRHKALQGGYMPNYASARSRFARDQGQLTSDATTNAEAGIAQMRQQGRLAGLGGMSGMYSATPGMLNMFGNQALQSAGQGLDIGRLYTMIAEMLNSKKGIDWGKWAGIAGNAAMAAAIASDKNLKTDIKEVPEEDIIDKFRKLKIYNWRYKGDDQKYTGPMAQDFRSTFGKGDGKRIKLIDVIGETLSLGKALASEARA